MNIVVYMGFFRTSAVDYSQFYFNNFNIIRISEEFQRAVKACVDYTLHPRLVETVFVVFDQDGDGHLSYHEFVCIMKDRLARGLSTVSRNFAGFPTSIIN